MTTSHTPTPWAYMVIENKYHIGTHHEGTKEIVTVATVYKGDLAIARCQSVEDAAFIVKASNAHIDLTELAKEIIALDNQRHQEKLGENFLRGSQQRYEDLLEDALTILAEVQA